MATAATQNGQGKQSFSVEKEAAQNGRKSYGKGKGKGPGKGPGKIASMLKDCPEQKKIEKIQEEQKQNRTKINSISELINAKAKEIEKEIAEVTGVRTKLNEEEKKIEVLKTEKNKIQEHIDVITKRRDISMKALNDARKNFAFSGKGSNEEFAATASKKLEDSIKEIENRISKGSWATPAEERSLVRDVNNLKKQRGEIGKFESKLAEFSKDKPLLDKLHGEKKEKIAEMQKIIQVKKDILNSRNDINTKINALKEQKKKLVEEKQNWIAKNEELSKQYKTTHAALDAKYNEVRQQQAEIAKKKREEYLERKKAEAEERARRKAAYEAELALKLPFEDEIDLCELLINYLVPLCPNQNANGKKKKKVSAVLSHQMSVFQHFEELSMSPPLTAVDVEDSLSQLRVKKDRFLDLQKAKIAEKEAAKKTEEEKATSEDASTNQAEQTTEQAEETSSSTVSEPAVESSSEGTEDKREVGDEASESKESEN